MAFVMLGLLILAAVGTAIALAIFFHNYRTTTTTTTGMI